MNATPPLDPRPTTRTLRILYAEDLEELRVLARMIVTPLGHTLECHANGLLAWDRVRLAPTAFDLIITDHHMPVMNGLEFVVRLRALPFPGKIIVFSSDLNPGNVVRYKELSVDWILNKPVLPHEFRHVLAELFPPTLPAPEAKVTA
jgi:CheY-like chemotaxis protein